MPLLLLVMAGLLFVVAYRGTQAAFASALETDIPGFLVWALAIVAVGAIGFVPRAAPISKALIVLILVVIFLTNYQVIIGTFQGAAQPVQAAQAPATPAQQYAAAVGAGAAAGGSQAGVGTALAATAAGGFLDAGASAAADALGIV